MAPTKSTTPETLEPVETILEPLPVVAAQASYEDAAAKAQEAQRLADDARAKADEARRLEMEAVATRTAATRARDLDYQRHVATAAPARIVEAGEDQRAALERFTAAVAETPWGAALVDYLSAMQRGRAWDARHAGALAALGGNPVHAGASMTPPRLDPDDVAAMIAGAITRAATDATGDLESKVAAHHRAYVDGQVDDPTPPADRA